MQKLVANGIVLTLSTTLQREFTVADFIGHQGNTMQQHGVPPLVQAANHTDHARSRLLAMVLTSKGLVVFLAPVPSLVNMSSALPAL